MTRANEPAFPRPCFYTANQSIGSTGQPGLTLREHYAGLAMQGIVDSEDYVNWEKLVKNSVDIADALIAELEKETK